VALRGDRWLATTDSAGWQGSPRDAATEEESASIVGEVAVAVAEAAAIIRVGRGPIGGTGDCDGEVIVGSIGPRAATFDVHHAEEDRALLTSGSSTTVR
jgi:hypothetical protein